MGPDARGSTDGGASVGDYAGLAAHRRDRVGKAAEPVVGVLKFGVEGFVSRRLRFGRACARMRHVCTTEFRSIGGD
jgi:hypothetical protein